MKTSKAMTSKALLVERVVSLVSSEEKKSYQYVPLKKVAINMFPEDSLYKWSDIFFLTNKIITSVPNSPNNGCNLHKN